jgi:hypothetical protein
MNEVIIKNRASVQKCSEILYPHKNLLASVKRIRQSSLQVHDRLVVGSDSDPARIFKQQNRLPQKNSIVTAMGWVLATIRGTKLYQRLERGGRL